MQLEGNGFLFHLAEVALTCCWCVMCVSVVGSRVTRLLLSPCLHPFLSILARDRQEKSFGSMMRAVLPSAPSNPPD